MKDFITTKRLILSLMTIIVFAGCSDSNKGQEGQNGQDRQSYFKAVSGKDAGVLPLIAIRKYDNQISTYSLWRDCTGLNMKLHSSATPLPLPKDELPGPFYMGPSCSIDITYDYSSGTPSAIGNIGIRGVDIEFQALSKEEFINEMKSGKVDFTEYYKNQSSFDQRTKLDSMCEDLFDQKCVNVFQF